MLSTAIGGAYTRVAVSEDAVFLAGVLAERYALRGADAVHLACALLVQRREPGVSCLAFDDRLVAAANKLLICHGPSNEV